MQAEADRLRQKLADEVARNTRECNITRSGMWELGQGRQVQAVATYLGNAGKAGRPVTSFLQAKQAASSPGAMV